MHLLAIFIALVGIVEAELEMVQVLFRHGDRAASSSYPTDIHTEASWPNGFSQLTEIGTEQSKELGSFLKWRYMIQHNLISEKFNRKQINVRSSDKDRCIQTAMGVMSSMYPGQYVPVHTWSAHWKDLLLKPNSIRCARADLLSDFDKGVLYAKNDHQYRELMEFLTKHTGMQVTMKNIKDVYNSVFREYSNGLIQPSWVFQNIYEQANITVFDYIVELKRQDRLTTFNSFEKSKLRTGYLLGKLEENMVEKAEGRSERKVNLYSTHDATITSLLYSLDVSNDLLPPYTAAILVELHNIDEQRFVQVLYRNSSTEQPHVLRIPGCQTAMCSLEEFRDFVAPRILRTEEDHTDACKLSSVAESYSYSTRQPQSYQDLVRIVLYSMVLLQTYFAVNLYFTSIQKEYEH